MGTAVDTIRNTSHTSPYTLLLTGIYCYNGVCPVVGGLLQPNQGGLRFSKCHSLAQQPDLIT